MLNLLVSKKQWGAVIILAFLEIGKTIALNIFSFALIQVYTNLKGKRAHAVNTGWAMLALIGAGQVCIVLFSLWLLIL